MFHKQEATAATAAAPLPTPSSFADLLCTAASDVIDWAPPGKVTAWQDQVQTAATTRRHADDVSYAGETAAGDVAQPGGTSPHVVGALPLRWWTNGLMNGLFAANSHSNIKLHESPWCVWTGGLTSSLSVNGFPLSLDAGWRVGTEVHWPQRKQRVAVLGQWTVPFIGGARPTVVQARLATPRVDLAMRADRKFYMTNVCFNVLTPPAQHPQGAKRGTTSDATQGSFLISTTPTASTTTTSFAASCAAATYQHARRYIRCLRTGLGLTIKNDLATGINLFTGAAVTTAGGLSASYHMDVLRRVTISVAQQQQHQLARSTTMMMPCGRGCQQGEHEDDEAHHVVRTSSQHSGPHAKRPSGDDTACSGNATSTVAFRLKLNAITYEGTVLEGGVSVPIRVVADTLVTSWRHYRRLRRQQNMPGEDTSVRTVDLDDHRARGDVAGRSVGRTMARLGRWLGAQPIQLQCSHSSVGSMVGVRWAHLQRCIPGRYAQYLGDLEIDVTAGLVARRSHHHPSSFGGGLQPEAAAAGGGGGSGQDITSSSRTNATSSSDGGTRFHSASSTTVMERMDSSSFGPSPTRRLQQQQQPSGTGSPNSAAAVGGLRGLENIRRQFAFASFLLISFE
jgi:hypothetical protein